ncbi:MAG: DUF2269 family protein [Streptosporangiales bacterium]|nr:DUF2269 family protein [Streptosporangiales bacterium]
MFVDNLLLWLHVAAAIFCVGPVTVATSFTPRYIRQGEPAVVRFLLRTTRIFGILTLLVFITGLALGRDRLAEPWLTVSMTLFIVAFALLFAMVQRDQSTALKVLTAAEAPAVEPAAGEATTDEAEDGKTAVERTTESGKTAVERTADSGVQPARIAAFSGVIALLWLVILVFMVWQPGA